MPKTRFAVNDDLWNQFAPLVARVEKPSRYLGQEWGSVEPSEKSDADYHAVLVYPDTYEIGQANQAIAVLYDCLNANERIYCERAYLPWVDMITAMRASKLPLVSLETYTPVCDFDFVGITLPHEMASTNILEFLDLSGIALHACDRTEDDPLVFGGGPLAYNPEPLASFFDAFFIGEGEELDLEVALLHRRMKQAGASREQILRELSHVEGVYVPSLYETHDQRIEGLSSEMRGYTVAQPRFDDVSPRVVKRVIQEFDTLKALPRLIVPYSELVHDRLAVEILRGCNRGCRFCQAGMIYRPVRERSADTIISAVAEGLACTGYDEVSLTSLSSTDHSTIGQMLRRLNTRFYGTGKSVSLPSQRVDALGVELARLAAGEKKGGLTLAPEAGTQRMRDSINKGVTEDDLMQAVIGAVEAGWRGFKLYFMIGLPGETDEDVAGIGALCKRVYRAAKDAIPDDQPRNIRLTVSVALFIPKPCTPFQWDGQIPLEEIQHRIEVLRGSFPKKGIDLRWHDSATSYVEAVLARGGRECAELIEQAWKNGARFDAWTEQFNFDAWQQAGQACGVPIMQRAVCEYEEGALLPWSHISCGVSEAFLRSERQKAHEAMTTPDCSFGPCSQCGVCQGLHVHNSTQVKRVLPEARL